MTHTPEAEIAILKARFARAQMLADILDGEGLTSSDLDNMDDEAWHLTWKCARLKSPPSTMTKALTQLLLIDREERKNRG